MLTNVYFFIFFANGNYIGTSSWWQLCEIKGNLKKNRPEQTNFNEPLFA